MWQISLCVLHVQAADLHLLLLPGLTRLVPHTTQQVAFTLNNSWSAVEGQLASFPAAVASVASVPESQVLNVSTAPLSPGNNQATLVVANILPGSTAATPLLSGRLQASALAAQLQQALRSLGLAYVPGSISNQVLVEQLPASPASSSAGAGGGGLLVTVSSSSSSSDDGQLAMVVGLSVGGSVLLAVVIVLAVTVVRKQWHIKSSAPCRPGGR